MTMEERGITESKIQLASYGTCGRPILRPGDWLTLSRGMRYSAAEKKEDNPYMKPGGRHLVRVATHIRIEKQVGVQDSLTVKSWFAEAPEPLFRQDYKMYDEKGDLAAATAVFLIMFDKNTRRAVTEGPLLDTVPPPVPGKQAFYGAMSRLMIPCALSFCERRRVRNSNIDLVGHMNTSQYGDFVYDTFSPEETAKTIREMQITFIKETRLGEELDIFRGADTDGTLYFRVLEAETKKPRFEAMIRFAPDGAAGEGTP